METPAHEATQAVHANIKVIVHPLWDTWGGYKDPGLDLLYFCEVGLKPMQQFLLAYINIKSPFCRKWMVASLDIVCTAEKGLWFAQCL